MVRKARALGRARQRRARTISRKPLSVSVSPYKGEDAFGGLYHGGWDQVKGAHHTGPTTAHHHPSLAGRTRSSPVITKGGSIWCVIGLPRGGPGARNTRKSAPGNSKLRVHSGGADIGADLSLDALARQPTFSPAPSEYAACYTALVRLVRNLERAHCPGISTPLKRGQTRNQSVRIAGVCSDPETQSRTKP